MLGFDVKFSNKIQLLSDDEFQESLVPYTEKCNKK